MLAHSQALLAEHFQQGHDWWSLIQAVDAGHHEQAQEYTL